jgi:hypothetical protein
LAHNELRRQRSTNLVAKFDFFNYDDFGGNSGDLGLFEARLFEIIWRSIRMVSLVHGRLLPAVPGTFMTIGLKSRRSSRIHDRIFASQPKL